MVCEFKNPTALCRQPCSRATSPPWRPAETRTRATLNNIGKKLAVVYNSDIQKQVDLVGFAKANLIPEHIKLVPGFFLHL